VQLGFSDAASKLGNFLNNGEMGISCSQRRMTSIASGVEISIMEDGVMHSRTARALGCHQR